MQIKLPKSGYCAKQIATRNGFFNKAIEIFYKRREKVKGMI